MYTVFQITTALVMTLRQHTCFVTQGKQIR
jgi:hypothetical protein